MSDGIDIPSGYSLIGPYGEGPVRIEASGRTEEGDVVVRGEAADEGELELEFTPEQFERFELVAPYAERSLEFDRAFDLVVQHERERLYRTTNICDKPAPYHLESSVPDSQRVRRLVVVPRPAVAEGLEVDGELREKLEASVGGLLALQRLGDGGRPDPPTVVSIAELREALSRSGDVRDVQLEELAVSEKTGFETLGSRLGHSRAYESELSIIRTCGGRAVPDGEASSEFAVDWMDLAEVASALDSGMPRNGPRWRRARELFLDLYTSEVPEAIRDPEGVARWEERYDDEREHHARLVRQIHRTMEYDDSPPIFADSEA